LTNGSGIKPGVGWNKTERPHNWEKDGGIKPGTLIFYLNPPQFISAQLKKTSWAGKKPRSPESTSKIREIGVDEGKSIRQYQAQN
jgi:hypothetical protein